MTYNTQMSCEQAFIGKEIKGIKRGVPGELFYSADFKGKIKTLSGLVLDCSISPNKIVLTEPHANLTKKGRDYCHFSAEVQNGSLSFTAFTKAFEGKPDYHPDLFASKLIEQSFAFFERQGTEIQRVICCWESPNDTYNQFMDALDLDSNPDPTHKQLKESVKQVLESKQIAKFGFTKLEESTLIWCNAPDYEEVLCEFTRE